MGAVRRAVTSLVLVSGMLLATSGSARAEESTSLLVLVGRLVDVEAGRVLADQQILIENGRISAVGQGIQAPPGATTLDLSALTVLPGLIDCHTHVTFQPGDNYYADLFRTSPMDAAVVAHVYARRTLEAGFTTIRDVGSGEYLDVSLKKAIDAGTIPGPRLHVATMAVGATGGHGDLSGFSPQLRFEGVSGIADGVDEIRKLIREEIKRGADHIKLVATAGVLSEEDSVGAPQYSLEEMRAAVEEAHMWERRVAAHAHGTEGIKRAIEAGVDSIEHGSLLDAEAIRMMKERGTWLVADIYNDDYILSEYEKKGYPEQILAKERLVGRKQRESFREAVRAGVKIAYGTDAGVYPHGWNARQFAKMVEWGMTPMQAIQAATIRAAELIGTTEVGALAVGRHADLVAVAGDPLADVTLLEHVSFVMKGGRIVRDER